MNDSPEIAAARMQVALARTRLIDTASELQVRLKPRTLAREAWEGAKIKGADLAEDAVDAVKARPVAAAGIAAAIGMFLAREPIIHAATRLFDDLGEKRAKKKQRKADARRSSAQDKNKPTAKPTAPPAPKAPSARSRSKVEKKS